MRTKLVTATTVLLLVVASLLASGCTSQNTASNAPSGHSILLEQFSANTKQVIYSSVSNVNVTANSSINVTAWDVIWNNETSVTVLFSIKGAEGNKTNTISGNQTAMTLPTTSAASDYLSALDKTKYTLVSTDYKSDNSTGWYYNATGHYPNVYKEYQYSEGGWLFSSETRHRIQQYDNLIVVTLGTISY
jgi:hypothetical protein